MYVNLRFFYCSGTLVASKYVITAAHCVYDDENAALAENAPLAPGDVKVIGFLNFDINIKLRNPPLSCGWGSTTARTRGRPPYPSLT